MLERIESQSGVVFYRSQLLAEAGVGHAFSTRVGGISSGRFASLNLGNPSEGKDRDSPENIETNYQRLIDAIGLPQWPRCSVHQVHGPTILTIQADQSFEAGQKADGLVSDDPRRILSVRTADCVPVLLATRDGRRCAAVHAGWRGVIAGAVSAAGKLVGGAGMPSVYCAIGPCISGAHFQVGPEVCAQFRNTFGRAAPISRETADGKGFVDLPAAIELQLRALGFDAIDRTDRCSFEHRDEFFSHRRDAGVTGRMAALIAPRQR